jgi:putative ABC transport system ATP-binding protein
MTPPDEHRRAARLRGVDYSYREAGRARCVLRGVDLDIGQGECLAILGRSGSGKTTLLNLLAGIDQPDAGAVEVADERVDRLGEPRRTLFRRRHIGFVYQFFNLVSTLTVAENVRLPLELNGAPAAGMGQRVQAILDACDLGDRATAFPDQLSGGEQQRVAICRALVHHPPLLLADEPTGNLDAETGRQVLGMLHELRGQRLQTLVLVTHSRQVASVADRILVLQGGELSTAAPGLAW